MLQWQEHLTDDEMPPEWMWALPHELEPWFDEVRQAREEKFGTNKSRDETVPMIENEYAERMRRR